MAEPYTFEGTAYLKYSDKDYCICCPGNHVYSLGVTVDGEDHNRNPSGDIITHVQRFIRREGESINGKRVRFTVEVIEKEPAHD